MKCVINYTIHGENIINVPHIMEQNSENIFSMGGLTIDVNPALINYNKIYQQIKTEILKNIIKYISIGYDCNVTFDEIGYYCLAYKNISSDIMWGYIDDPNKLDFGIDVSKLFNIKRLIENVI